MDERKEEILRCFENIDKNQYSLIIKLVDDMLFLENQLEDLRKLPLIKVHPQNPELMKQTSAGKLYKDFLQQYNNIVRTLCSILHKDEASGDESPLREYFKRLSK